MSLIKGKRLVIVPAAVLFLFILLVAGLNLFVFRDLPTVSVLKDYQPNLVTKVYSHDGQLIGEFYVEKRTVVPIHMMPPHLVNAFLAAEDAQFYKHEGVSYTGLLRAFYKNLMAGHIVQGGSTITQQVARSFFLSSEKKLSRKLKEMVLAHRMERYLEKEDILNLYLNKIYLGNGAYGVQTAAQAYFGKDVQDLDLAEAALLAGLPKAPSKYSPYVNFELSKKRQEYVLRRMVEEGFITPEMDRAAAGESIRLKPREMRALWVGPYFTEHVRRYVEEKYGEELLYRGGLRIYTTLDVGMQKAANEAVSREVREFDKRRGYRGPALKLSPGEIEAFMEETDRNISERPVATGSVVEGVVRSVDRKSSSLTVDVGSLSGTIRNEDLLWAGVYNPSGGSEGRQVKDLMSVFHPGDVIEVRVKEVNPLLLSLEQTPLVQAALLAVEPGTGYVRAMVGGMDFSRSQFNRAVQARRQPGSAFKPIIYAAAIDRDYTPATVVMDTPVVFKGGTDDWRPRNFDESFEGPTTVREALAKSRNVVTIKILEDIGVPYAISYAGLLGIKSPLASNLSLALGSSAVTLLEMTRAFSTFANLGLRPEPVFIRKITDKNGNVLEENKPFLTEAINPQTSFIMTSLLQGVVEEGTGARARSLGRPAAGKTGTTNDLNDAWFIGYVPGLVAGVWVGYDDEKPLGHNETGAVAALPVWMRFMEKALAGKPVENFKVPEGVEFTKIDSETGLRAGPYTRNAIFEVFKTGTAPTAFTPPKGGESDDFFMLESETTPAGTKGAEREREFFIEQ